MLAENVMKDPLIYGGGPSVWNSEPVAPLFDAILLGDGESAGRDVRVRENWLDEFLMRFCMNCLI